MKVDCYVLTVNRDPQLYLPGNPGLLFVFVGNPAIFTGAVGSRPKSILRVCLWHGKAKAVWIARRKNCARFAENKNKPRFFCLLFLSMKKSKRRFFGLANLPAGRFLVLGSYVEAKIGFSELSRSSFRLSRKQCVP